MLSSYVSSNIYFTIVIRNGKIVWKHGPNEFRELLEPSPRELAWNTNKKLRKTTDQLKVKGLSLCFVLNLRMSGYSWLIFNWHSSRAASGISYFWAPTKDDEYNIKRRNNIVAVVACDTRQGDEGNLKRQIKNPTFWVELSSRKIDLSKVNYSY